MEQEEITYQKIEELVNRFPFSSYLHLQLIQSLQTEGKQFNEELKRAALRVPNRLVLQNVVETKIKTNQDNNHTTTESDLISVDFHEAKEIVDAQEDVNREVNRPVVEEFEAKELIVDNTTPTTDNQLEENNESIQTDSVDLTEVDVKGDVIEVGFYEAKELVTAQTHQPIDSNKPNLEEIAGDQLIVDNQSVSSSESETLKNQVKQPEDIESDKTFNNADEVVDSEIEVLNDFLEEDNNLNVVAGDQLIVDNTKNKSSASDVSNELDEQLDAELEELYAQASYEAQLAKELSHEKTSERIDDAETNSNEQATKKDFLSWVKTYSNATSPISSPANEREKDDKNIEQKEIVQKRSADIIQDVIHSKDEDLKTISVKEIQALAKKSMTKDPAYYTETLAYVYILQGKFSKAIEVYEELARQNPKKSSYFASEIDKLNEKLK